jgi:GTPase SAR1 family protein
LGIAGAIKVGGKVLTIKAKRWYILLSAGRANGLRHVTATTILPSMDAQMDLYQSSREEVLHVNQEVKTLLKKSKSVIGNGGTAFVQWEQASDMVARQLMDHVVRIAVVGAIKSGKSTLVNSLLGDDFLKRGAGVVTSIVTRIRQGDRLRARLFFKSWDEINDEIQQALVLFPTQEWRLDDRPFDIRRDDERRHLQQALDALDGELRIVQDSMNANSVLLSSYLKGYDRIKTLVSAESAVREFDNGDFPEHREFVGNDALAVYLKDLLLEVPGDILTNHMEIADCQGSDSPNPLHLAMIQDYLLKAHLVIYVISSRTGVRQADIRFLSIIKRMGIAENMLFVVNCDFNEHDGLEDLETLVKRVKEELALIVAEAELFVLSALFHLFGAARGELTARDQERLNQWRHAEALVAYSDAQTHRLRTVLSRKLSLERSALLLQNQLERIDVTANGLRQWLKLNRDLLRRDSGDARSMADRLHTHQGRMLQVQAMIQSTLDGAVAKLTKELKSNTDRFFDHHGGPVLQNVFTFVRAYRVDPQRCEEQLAASGFTQTLYLVFQEFKQALDGLMAEKVNPDIIGFVHQEEMRLREQLRLVAEPYEAMIKDALTRYDDELGRYGLSAMAQGWTLHAELDLAVVKQGMNLTLPPAAAALHYSANIRTEAVMRLGFYSVVRMFRKILRRTVGGKEAEELRALKDSVRKMKKETERSIAAHFRDYKENLKFQYLQPLAQASGRRLFGILTEQFVAGMADVKGLASAIDAKRSDKTGVDKSLEEIEKSTTELQMQLQRMREKIRLIMDDHDLTSKPTAK